jgi:tellurite resistance protein TerC
MKRIEWTLERTGLGRGSPVRKILIALIGTTVLLIGVALIVLPGPAFIVIPLGLGILATEFIWARRVIERGRALFNKIRGRPIQPTR